jgi:hypothetical protein
LQFNTVAYRRRQQLRAMKGSPVDSASGSAIRLVRMDAALEIQALASKVDSLLDVFARRLESLSAKLMGNG